MSEVATIWKPSSGAPPSLSAISFHITFVGPSHCMGLKISNKDSCRHDIFGSCTYAWEDAWDVAWNDPFTLRFSLLMRHYRLSVCTIVLSIYKIAFPNILGDSKTDCAHSQEAPVISFLQFHQKHEYSVCQTQCFLESENWFVKRHMDTSNKQLIMSIVSINQNFPSSLASQKLNGRNIVCSHKS